MAVGDVELGPALAAKYVEVAEGLVYINDANQRVGIGTPTPQKKIHTYNVGGNNTIEVGVPGTHAAEQSVLELQTLGDPESSLGDATTQGWQANARGDAWSVAAQRNDYHLAYWDGSGWTTALTVESGGRVGINTFEPSHKLTVEEDIAGYVAKFFNDGDNVDRAGIIIQCGENDQTASTNYYVAALDGDGDSEGYIVVVNGNFELAQGSDIRRKTDIASTKIVGLDIINDIKVREFRRIHKENKGALHKVGYIAQELEEVFPDMVFDDSYGKKFIIEAKLIPVLVKAVQEQQEQIEELKKRVEE